MSATQDYLSPALDNHDVIPSGIYSPMEHLRAVCPSMQNNVVVMQRRWATGALEWKSLNARNAIDSLDSMRGAFDLYFTPNEFYGKRETSRLAALNAFFVDIDAHGVGDRRDPTDMAQEALVRLRLAQMPEPNLIVYTGRGCHFYWLFYRTHKAALPRWYRVQDTLCTLLGGDRGAKDVARVLRFAGSRNSRAPKERLTATCETVNTRRYEFDWLCDQILPFTREELRELRLKRQCEKAARSTASTAGAGPRSRPRRNSEQGQIWQRRARDLVQIANANFVNGQLPEGKRNRILFYLSSCMAWLHPADQLLTAVEEAAAELMPSYCRSEVRSCVSTVLKRAVRDGQGEKLTWNGKQIPNRYRFRSDTLWNGLSDLIEPHEGLLQSLECILPKGMLDERKRDRDRSRDRVAEGRYKQHRIELDEIRRDRIARAISLADAGTPLQAIAEALAVTVRTIRSYLANARDRATEAAQGVLEALTNQAECRDTTVEGGISPATERSARSLWWAKPGLFGIRALSTSRGSSGTTLDLFSVDTPTNRGLNFIKTWLGANKKSKPPK